MVCPSLVTHVFDNALDAEERNFVLSFARIRDSDNHFTLLPHDKGSRPVWDEFVRKGKNLVLYTNMVIIW